MGRRIKAPGKIFHHRSDPAAPPAFREDEIAEQKAQSISDIQPSRRNPRAVSHPRSSSKSPRAEASHKAAQPSHQPRDPVPSPKIFRRSPVKSQNVESHPHHQQRVKRDHQVVNVVRIGHIFQGEPDATQASLYFVFSKNRS